MVSLPRLIEYLYPQAISPQCPNDGSDYMLSTDGIATWNAAKLGPQPTPAELTAAEVPVAKQWAISANRAECSRRIFARYPAGRQLSALAGMYDSANVQAMQDWISSMIAAENTAADAIEAATTVQEVEAVTVAWPA